MGSESLLDTDREVISGPERQPVGTLTRKTWKDGDIGREGEGGNTGQQSEGRVGTLIKKGRGGEMGTLACKGKGGWRVEGRRQKAREAQALTI